MTIEQEIKRDTKGRFPTGVSGNPGGRPSSKGIVQYIKDKTNGLQDLIDNLLHIYKDKNTSKKDRIKIIEVLLDRAMGKPAQFQNINLDTDIIVGLPEDLKDKDF